MKKNVLKRYANLNNLSVKFSIYDKTLLEIAHDDLRYILMDLHLEKKKQDKKEIEGVHKPKALNSPSYKSKYKSFHQLQEKNYNSLKKIRKTWWTWLELLKECFKNIRKLKKNITVTSKKNSIYHATFNYDKNLYGDKNEYKKYFLNNYKVEFFTESDLKYNKKNNFKLILKYMFGSIVFTSKYIYSLINKDKKESNLKYSISVFLYFYQIYSLHFFIKNVLINQLKNISVCLVSEATDCFSRGLIACLLKNEKKVYIVPHGINDFEQDLEIFKTKHFGWKKENWNLNYAKFALPTINLPNLHAIIKKNSIMIGLSGIFQNEIENDEQLILDEILSISKLYNEKNIFVKDHYQFPCLGLDSLNALSKLKIKVINEKFSCKLIKDMSITACIVLNLPTSLVYDCILNNIMIVFGEVAKKKIRLSKIKILNDLLLDNNINFIINKRHEKIAMLQKSIMSKHYLMSTKNVIYNVNSIMKESNGI